MNKKTLMTNNKALQQSDDIDGMCQEKEEEDSPSLRIVLDASIQGLGEYSKKGKKY